MTNRTGAKTQRDLKYPIRQFMTPSPHSVTRDQTLAHAQERMRALGARHLPVLEGGKLVGILEQRAASFVESLRDVDAATLQVEVAMSVDVYVVHPDTPLTEVANSMAEHKYGCAVIVDETHVVGIFTTVDALRALIAVVESAPAPSGAPPR
jgi:acetoin utilization protein AcuB